MGSTPTAVGYLRKDVSDVHQPWDETQIRTLAKRFGYELIKTVVFGPATDDPEWRLVNVVRALRVDAVITPSLAHFGGEVPATLVGTCELNTVTPQATYTRRYDEIRRATGA
ncbi:hypothetical protein [Nocardia sp. NPDC050710]|uniref:hypothetical protein n=1 Tax=Nocardia sp. NPDC050710 TaxID=3157220 RepID=UPI0033DEE2DB